jgi:hypothetical protein
MNPLNKEIRDRIELFAEELAELIRQAAVESVQEALGQKTSGRTAPRKKARRAAAGRPKKKAAARKSSGRVRRSPEQLQALCSKIASYVNSHPGKGVEAIGAALGLATSEMQRPVAVLLETKKLKKKGKLRGTTYYARGASTGRKKATTLKPAKPRKAVPKKKARRQKVASAS